MSSLAWLDSSDHDRRKALDVIRLFSEKDTRDELGIGSVRDAFSEILFPGTSTVQTRARYFFFIPWIYLTLEQRNMAPGKFGKAAKDAEVKLIDALAESDDPYGTIGLDARQYLKRMPSSVYWHGLGRLGIRRFHGSRDSYYRSAGSVFGNVGGGRMGEDEEYGDLSKYNWHPGLPSVPEDFPGETDFILTNEEAEFFAERVRTSAPGSFFSFLLDNSTIVDDVDFPWIHPETANAPENIRTELLHARNFSDAMHGAALLYNLMLAEKVNEEEWIDDYREELDLWTTERDEAGSRLSEWKLPELWKVAARGRTNISRKTMRFVEEWVENGLKGDRSGGVANDPVLRQLIHDRERFLKRKEARLDNPRALEKWAGASGTGKLDYRWGTVKVMLDDVLKGRGV